MKTRGSIAFGTQLLKLMVLTLLVEEAEPETGYIRQTNRDLLTLLVNANVISSVSREGFNTTVKILNELENDKLICKKMRLGKRTPKHPHGGKHFFWQICNWAEVADKLKNYPNFSLPVAEIIAKANKMKTLSEQAKLEGAESLLDISSIDN